MLTLYAELSGIYGRNRYKEAYREIRQALSFSGTDERQQATTRNGFASIVPKKKRISLTEEEWDYRDQVYKEMLTFLKLKETRHPQDPYMVPGEFPVHAGEFSLFFDSPDKAVAQKQQSE